MGTRSPITADANNPLTAGSLYPQPNGWLVLPDYLVGLKGVEQWPSPIAPGRTAYFVEVGSDAWEAFVRHDATQYQNKPPTDLSGVGILPDVALGVVDVPEEPQEDTPGKSVTVQPAEVTRTSESRTKAAVVAVLAQAFRPTRPPLDILVLLILFCLAMSYE